MKKILFATNSLGLGGIETAMLSLVNYLAKQKINNEYKYDITIVLEKKEGIFLNLLDNRINLLEFTPDSNKITILRKFKNFIKQYKFKKIYKNKFDFSAAYATYSLPSCFVARIASRNSTLWCHMDYLEQYNNDYEKVKRFFEEKKYKEFKNIVFVSKQGKESFLKVFPNEKNVYAINNIIDYKTIIEKSKENVKENLDKDVTLFLNIGRHDEEQKKLSRIIDAAKKLNDEGYKFRILFVGDGKDNKKYKNMVKQMKLENNILFLGKRKNPYPYFKISDCVLLSSEYEGSPVVYTEAMVLNKPVITTNVSGSDQIDGRFGYVIKKDQESLYEAMKEFINNGYTIKEKFDAEKYNQEIAKKIEMII